MRLRKTRAAVHEDVAQAEEGLEQVLHAAADQLDDPAGAHETANRLSARARSHQRRADDIRRRPGGDG